MDVVGSNVRAAFAQNYEFTVWQKCHIRLCKLLAIYPDLIFAAFFVVVVFVCLLNPLQFVSFDVTKCI